MIFVKSKTTSFTNILSHFLVLKCVVPFLLFPEKDHNPIRMCRVHFVLRGVLTREHQDLIAPSERACFFYVDYQSLSVFRTGLFELCFIENQFSR